MGGELTEHLEIESKFDVGTDFVVPDLRGVADGSGVTGPEVRLLAAHYYDTGDLRLAAAKVILRRRTGGPDAGWHLKLRAGAGRRRELQAPLGDEDADVPPQLAALVSGWVRDEPLRIVAVLETRRTVRNLTGADGQVLAEVADDLVTGRLPGPGDDPGEPVIWREVEVELVTGGPQILAAARSRLTAGGARPSNSPSKLARLLSTRPAAPAG
jgi:inorganic triphosphatase YgiF